MTYKKWVIESEGIPIGFFQEQNDASDALTKYVTRGIISERELSPYKCWNVQGKEVETKGD